MEFHSIDKNLNSYPYIKSIFTICSDDHLTLTKLPFFADGFPGLMYQKTSGGIKIKPHTKDIPPLFIYGQTIEPIVMEVTGKYEIIIIQLYPFSLKRLFDIEPKSINDDCSDVNHPINNTVVTLLENLNTQKDIKTKINMILTYLEHLTAARKPNIDKSIVKAIKYILLTKGQCNIMAIANELHINKRTFERKFLLETGLLPKQFAKIIQFQNSLTQLSKKEYDLLTDIVYNNGYADQSHFIRVFKSFTKKTPKKFSL